MHTFDRFLTCEKHFDEHPEYFAENNSRRVKTAWQQGQLCCTNEDVARIITEKVLVGMRKKSTAYVSSVSINDNSNYCTCEKCAALAAKEESQMAPVLQLVNRVAAEVEKEFPERCVETLAYTWTTKPPKTLRPRHNVVIRPLQLRQIVERSTGGDGLCGHAKGLGEGYR